MVYATSEYLTQTGHRALPELVPPKTLLFVPQHADCVMVRLPSQSEGTDSNSGVNLFGRWSTFSENSKHIIEINIKNGQPKSGKDKAEQFERFENQTLQPHSLWKPVGLKHWLKG